MSSKKGYIIIKVGVSGIFGQRKAAPGDGEQRQTDERLLWINENQGKFSGVKINEFQQWSEFWKIEYLISDVKVISGELCALPRLWKDCIMLIIQRNVVVIRKTTRKRNGNFEIERNGRIWFDSSGGN